MTKKTLTYRKLAYRPWPVVVTFLACDEATGEVTEHEAGFVGHFRPLKPKEVQAIRREIFGDETDPDNQKRLGAMLAADYAELEARFFGRLLDGWSHLLGEDGAPLPYSEALLTEMCTGEDGAAFRRGLNQAAFQIALGIAPRKNSKPSPEPGPSSGEGTGETSSTTT